MRRLKSATTTSTSTTTMTTLKGKRKLAQTKDYPESPPATPPPAPVTKGSRGKKRMSDVNSPPQKRRRSSDRIAKQVGQKRESLEDDDGFVFTRPAKKKAATITSKAEITKPTAPSKPFIMDFTEVLVFARRILMIDSRRYQEPLPTFSTT